MVVCKFWLRGSCRNGGNARSSSLRRLVTDSPLQKVAISSIPQDKEHNIKDIRTMDNQHEMGILQTRSASRRQIIRETMETMRSREVVGKILPAVKSAD